MPMDYFADDPRTNLERMIAGDLYIADDPEIARRQQQAVRLAARYQAAYVEDADAARPLLAELLGALGAEAHVRPPLYVDYGTNITIGARTFVNYNLTALDVAAITIGEDCAVPLGSMTYHFSGMDDLLREAFRHFTDHVVALFDTHLAPPADPEEARAAVADLIHALSEGSQRGLILTQELYTLAARRPAYRELTQEWMARSRVHLERHVDAATARQPDALIEGLALHRALSPVPHDRALTLEPSRASRARDDAPLSRPCGTHLTAVPHGPYAVGEGQSGGQRPWGSFPSVVMSPQAHGQLPQASVVLDFFSFGHQGLSLVQMHGAVAQYAMALCAQGATVVVPGGNAPGDGRVEQDHVDAGQLCTTQSGREVRACGIKKLPVEVALV
ncbi:hypothetical protein GCM10027072_48270 [Streptomyces bullii]